MANDQSSRLGLFPIRQPFGNIPINYYRANTAIAMYRFQPVVLNNSGQVQVAQIIGASGILGSIVGFLDSSKASLPSDMALLTAGAFLPSSADAYVAVADDPGQYFIMEEDTGGTLIGSANSSGQTVHFTYLATTGNTTTGVANVLIDRSTLAADTGGVFTLIGPADNINSDGTTNTPTSAFAKWIVKINSHQNAPISGYKIADRPS